VRETLKMYGEAMSQAGRPEEKKLVLAGLGDVASPEALSLAQAWLGDEAVKAEAALASFRIAQAILGSHREEAKAAMAKLLALSKDAALRKQIEGVLGQFERFEDYLVSWQVAGPYTQEGKDFQQLFDVVFAPERPEAKGVAWRPLPAGTDPARPIMLDLLKALGGEQRVAYVRTWIHSAKEQPARLELGTDDGNKVWLNAELIHSKNVGRKAIPGAERVNVTLRQGWNLLLLKITQATGPWEFCARLRTREGDRLDGVRVDGLRDAP